MVRRVRALELAVGRFVGMGRSVGSGMDRKVRRNGSEGGGKSAWTGQESRRGPNWLDPARQGGTERLVETVGVAWQWGEQVCRTGSAGRVVVCRRGRTREGVACRGGSGRAGRGRGVSAGWYDAGRAGQLGTVRNGLATVGGGRSRGEARRGQARTRDGMTRQVETDRCGVACRQGRVGPGAPRKWRGLSGWKGAGRYVGKGGDAGAGVGQSDRDGLKGRGQASRGGPNGAAGGVECRSGADGIVGVGGDTAPPDPDDVYSADRTNSNVPAPCDRSVPIPFREACVRMSVRIS